MISPLVTLNSMTCAHLAALHGGSSQDVWRRKAAVRRSQARLRHLASGIGDRTGGLLARHQLGDREDVVGVALRRMHFADEDVRHQFVIAGAIDAPCRAAAPRPAAVPYPPAPRPVSDLRATSPSRRRAAPYASTHSRTSRAPTASFLVAARISATNFTTSGTLGWFHHHSMSHQPVCASGGSP